MFALRVWLGRFAGHLPGSGRKQQALPGTDKIDARTFLPET
jgi:hypothetical protein